MKWIAKQLLFWFILSVLTICLILYRFPLSIQTGLTDLIPTEESLIPPELFRDQSGEAYLLIQAPDFSRALPAAQALKSELKNLPDTDTETSAVPSLRHLKNFLLAHANAYLSDSDRELLRKGETTTLRKQTVQTVLTSLKPSFFPVTQDPFQLLSRYVDHLSFPSGSWLPRDGFLTRSDQKTSYILIPFHFTTTDIEKMSSALSRLQTIIQAQSAPDITVFLTGTPVHTVRTYLSTRFDISLFSTLSVIGMILLTFLLFRRWFVLLPILIDLLIAFITGTLLLFFVYPMPHLITFVFGSALIGICIDYSFHFLSDQDKSKRDIFYSFATTVVCFIPLSFSGIPLLTQIALLTLGGLSGAFLWLFLTYRDLPHLPVQSLSIPVLSRRLRILIGFTFLCLGSLAVFLARPDCRLSDLYRPDPDLAQAESLFHRLNDRQFSHFLIIRSDSVQSVLEAEESLKKTHSFFGISDIFPSARRQSENQSLIRTLYQKESSFLTEALGLTDSPTFRETPPVTRESFQQTGFDSLLDRFLKKTDTGYIDIIPIQDRLSDLPKDIIQFSPTDYLTTQLRRYARDSYQNLFYCLIGLFFLLTLLYRKQAFWYLFPSLLGLGSTLGILLLLGHTITVFHILSLFIVLGLSLDYTIFHFSSDSPSHLRPVLFSFLSSLIGFGLLSGTGFFLVHIMGLTIAIGLSLCYLVSLFVFRGRS